MAHLHRRSIVIGGVVLIFALAGGTVFAANQVFSGVAAAPSNLSTPAATLLSATPAGVGTTETTDEGLTVTLLQLVKHGPRWLFHFRLKNEAHGTLAIRGTSDVHQFVVSGNTKVAPPNNIGVARLSSPSASEVAAAYPNLVTTLPSGGTAQGWLAVDTANLGFAPAALLYRYAAVPTLGCTDPADASTCKTETLYQALIWYLF